MCGVFEVAGTDRRTGCLTAARQPGEHILVDSKSAVADSTWPNGCHICEVEIDPETGHVDIASYASVTTWPRRIR
jgi:carbon-monoxide dehydrogenase large subunit